MCAYLHVFHCIYIHVTSHWLCFALMKQCIISIVLFFFFFCRCMYVYTLYLHGIVITLPSQCFFISCDLYTCMGLLGYFWYILSKIYGEIVNAIIVFTEENLLIPLSRIICTAIIGSMLLTVILNFKYNNYC